MSDSKNVSKSCLNYIDNLTSSHYFPCHCPVQNQHHLLLGLLQWSLWPVFLPLPSVILILFKCKSVHDTPMIKTLQLLLYQSKKTYRSTRPTGARHFVSSLISEYFSSLSLFQSNRIPTVLEYTSIAAVSEPLKVMPPLLRMLSFKKLLTLPYLLQVFTQKVPFKRDLTEKRYSGGQLLINKQCYIPFITSLFDL